MHIASDIGAGAGSGSGLGLKVAVLDPEKKDSFKSPDAGSSPTSASSATPARRQSTSSSLVETFGYYGASEFSTLALVRKLVPEDDIPDAKDITLPTDIAAEVRRALDAMLCRPIIDVLIRFFFAKVNWIDQLLYSPWFLVQYQKWWALKQVSSIADVEFAILFLRVCCYASQFLPSPGYTIDSIKGVPLSDIRKSCGDVISILSPICASLDTRGSLIRVQHLGLAALASRIICHMDAVWEHVSCATRVAQQIGLPLASRNWPGDMDEIEKEMRRRTFCNLYIWDSCLALRLQRIPFLHDDGLCGDIMPRMRLVPNSELGSDAPDVFTERVLRAQLHQFWRRHLPKPTPGSKLTFDVVATEERYEVFCSEFLKSVPPAFALSQPDRQWDEHLPTLPMQRHLLHMAVYEFLCYNFSPTILLQPDELGHLSGYKQVLTVHGRKALAVAALSLLESVTEFHALMGGSHTRYSGIITPIFEGAVPLLCLCADPQFPGSQRLDLGAAGTGRAQNLDADLGRLDPLGARLNNVSRSECIEAANRALKTLQTLAEVSEMADVGARTLAQLIRRVESSESSSCDFDSECLAVKFDSKTEVSPTSLLDTQNAGVDGASELIWQWPCDPILRDPAGGDLQNDLGLAATAMMFDTGNDGEMMNFEDMLRDMTGNIGI